MATPRGKSPKGAAKPAAQSKTKPLSEQLAELFDPTPKDYDPEALDINVGEEIDPAVWHGDAEDSEAPVPTVTSKRLALQSDIDMGKKYAGKRTTRESFLDLSPLKDANDDSTEPSEGEDDLSEGSGDGTEEGDEESEQGGRASSTKQPWEAAVQEADMLQAELERQEQEQAQEPAIVGAKEDDTAKAEHTRNQRRVFDGVLELRMKLQKPLTIASRLPAPVSRSAFIAHNEQVALKYESVAAKLRNTMEEIHALQTSLLSLNGSLCEPTVATTGKSKKRMLDDDLPEDPVKLHEHFMPFIDPVIDKWQHKTQIASGGIAGKRFRALNQSVGAQVKVAIGEKDKIIKKTQLLRLKGRILGSVSDAKTASGAQYSVEVYDDGDFYQQLLKDLVQQKADPQNPIQMTRTYLAQRNQVKVRKDVDRKASKGRKIRYKVHDKLVNFMAPVTKETPGVAAELFTKLFQS